MSRVRSASARAQVLDTMMAGVMMPTMAATTCWRPRGTSWPGAGIPSREKTEAGVLAAGSDCCMEGSSLLFLSYKKLFHALSIAHLPQDCKGENRAGPPKSGSGFCENFTNSLCARQKVRRHNAAGSSCLCGRDDPAAACPGGGSLFDGCGLDLEPCALGRGGGLQASTLSKSGRSPGKDSSKNTLLSKGVKWYIILLRAEGALPGSQETGGKMCR